MTLFSTLKQKTEKLRYKIIGLQIKHFAPSFYERLANLHLFGFGFPVDIFIHKLPRPSVKFMQYYFAGKPVTGCEVGVQKGLNSKSILKSLNISELHLVDSWDKSIDVNGPKYCKMVLDKFWNNPVQIKIKIGDSVSISRVFSDNSLDFVYIDACHEYKSALADINAWAPKVKTGGIVAGHDVFNAKGVIQAVLKYCNDNQVLFYLHPPDWFFVKSPIGNAKCRCKNCQYNICQHSEIYGQ